jgi:hypothetical protein
VWIGLICDYTLASCYQVKSLLCYVMKKNGARARLWMGGGDHVRVAYSGLCVVCPLRAADDRASCFACAC